MPAEFACRPEGDTRLTLISGAAHHFTSSSFANLPSLVAKEGATAWIEIHPEDARRRGISDGAMVVVTNARSGDGERSARCRGVAEGALAIT